MFHLAAQTSVFNTDKPQIVRDNIETFISVCDACKQAVVKTEMNLYLVVLLDSKLAFFQVFFAN